MSNPHLLRHPPETEPWPLLQLGCPHGPGAGHEDRVEHIRGEGGPPALQPVGTGLPMHTRATDPWYEREREGSMYQAGVGLGGGQPVKEQFICMGRRFRVFGVCCEGSGGCVRDTIA